MRKRFVFALFALCALGGCDPTEFDRLRDQSPVVVWSSSAGPLAGTFGKPLTTYRTSVAGNDVSRIVAAGGENVGLGSQFTVFYGFDRVGPQADAAFERGAFFSGCHMNECGTPAGTAIAAFPEWPGEMGVRREGCIAAPSPSGKITVRCESAASTSMPLVAPAGEDFGRSAVGIPRAAHRVGVALFGAPQFGGSQGAIYALPKGGVPTRIDTTAAGAISGLGRSLAVSARQDERLIFAAGASGDKVLVAEVSVDGGGTQTVQIRRCLQGPTGFGGALAFGDLDGDGADELVIGSDDEAADHDISIISLSDPVNYPCGTTQPPPAMVMECIDAVPDGSTLCGDDEGFGASIAIGEVNGDAYADLVIGAPRANDEAGAVLVVGGGPGGLAQLGRGPRAVLSYAQQPRATGLGGSVALLPGRGRDEIVAGAPRAGLVVLFLCSGIDGDTPASVQGERGCLPDVE